MGHSIPEIKNISGRSAGSILKYIKGVNVLPDFRESLRIKQGGSRARSEKNWSNAKHRAAELLGSLSGRDIMILLTAIYWSEGSKKDLSLINGDPYLIKTFIKCLYEIGVNRNDIKINIRLYTGMNKKVVTNFWVKLLKINNKQITGYEIVEGDGSRKLEYGMCRVRVRRPALYFKLIMSMIDFIKFGQTPS